jgi:glycogen operon protein
MTFRRDHPVFRRRRWFQGSKIRGIEDLAWLRPDGEEMTDDDWEVGFARAVAVFMNGESIPTTDTYGERIVDDSFLVIFNASDQPIDWCIPGPQWSRRWTIDLDTSDPKRGSARTINKRPGDTLEVLDRSMVVLRSVRAASRHPVHARSTTTTAGGLAATDAADQPPPPTTDPTSEEPTTR